MLPHSLEETVRVVSIAPHVRKTFELLPEPVRLDAHLPRERTPRAHVATQLVKLGLLGCGVRLGDVTVSGEGRATIVLSRGGKSISLADDVEPADVRALVPWILGGLFDARDTAHVLERLAFQSSALATLRTLTSAMLSAGDPDTALTLFLAGVTSGHGLGLHRAVLFARDADGTLRGTHAVGPDDEAEAHRVWEALEIEDVGLDRLVEDIARGAYDRRLETRARGIVLPESGEVSALLAGDGPARYTRPPESPALALLGGRGGFVLAPLRTRDGVVGVVYADNLFPGARISDDAFATLPLYVGQTMLVWENLALFARVDALSRVDPLTGLANRRELDVRFEAERSRAERRGSSLSLLVLDVDHFKRVNDERGHAEGDTLLRALGEILRGSSRPHDVAARYGGDELVLLLPDCGPEEAAAAAGRIGKLAKEKGISLSIGGASFPSGDAPQATDLFRSADSELYRAKRSGRGLAFVAGARVTYD
jgi:diguanylate cyclase (GGDEF)-like protein